LLEKQIAKWNEKKAKVVQEKDLKEVL